MFSQSQVIIAFFPEWLNLAFWCVCVCVCVCVRFCHTRSCIASRDPYCGWKPHGACERIQPGVLWVHSPPAIWSTNITDERMTRIFIYFLLSLLFWINICFYLSFSLSLSFQGWIWAGCWIWKHGPPRRLSRYRSHLHAMLFVLRHIQTHTCSYTHTVHKLISAYTMSLHTHISNHSSNLPLH